MPWCPECRCEYRDGFFRCADCGVWLTNIKPPEKEKKPVPVSIEPKLWAQSTMTSQTPGEVLVEVKQTEGRARIWLHDVLDDNGIPYKIEIAQYLIGGGKLITYKEKQCVHVAQRDVDTVRGLIREYENTDNLVPEDLEAGQAIDRTEDGLPQIQCPACGKDIDLDYAKCPLCNYILQER